MSRFFQLAVHHLGLRDHPEPWEGPTGKYFISDKEATVQFLERSPHFNERQVALLRPLFGKLILVYLEDESWSISTDEDFVQRLDEPRIVRRGTDFVITSGEDKALKYRYRCRIQKDGDGFWAIGSKMIPHYRERFRELSEEAFTKATDHLPRDANGAFIESEWPKESLNQMEAARQISSRKIWIRRLVLLICWGVVVKMIIDFLVRWN